MCDDLTTDIYQFCTVNTAVIMLVYCFLNYKNYKCWLVSTLLPVTKHKLTFYLMLYFSRTLHAHTVAHSKQSMKIIRNCPSINLFQYLTVIYLILLIISFFNQFSSGYSHYHLSQFYTQHTPYLKIPSKDIHKFLLLSITKP